MRLTDKQEAAQSVMAGAAEHVMLFGGSRSGKTFLLVRAVVVRALKAPKSRHAILRFRFNHVKSSIILDTFPKVMELCFADVDYRLDKSDWYVTLPNDSQIWFGGLDDKERTEKILGQEHVTIYLNECSQIPFGSREMARTRLAQKVSQSVDGREKPMRTRMYYDCNPPTKAHWTYKLFVQKVDPDTGKPLGNPENYAHFQINPQDNVDNLSEGYLSNLQNMGGRMRRRFYEGEFGDATPNALFQEEWIDRWRVLDGDLPDFVRVVVGVDPSGSGDADNADNDAIGIVAGAIGTDGNAYLLEDNTVKAGPGTWGKVAASAYERHDADVIVGEQNFGGEMVRYVIQTARPKTNYKDVHASRGKIVRAEPFSALYEQGKIRHVGNFPELEGELCAFNTAGYMGERSPNRADAWIWVLSELFPAVVAGPKKPKSESKPKPRVAGSWMGA